MSTTIRLVPHTVDTEFGVEEIYSVEGLDDNAQGTPVLDAKTNTKSAPPVAPPQQNTMAITLTDRGNAQRFVRRFNDSIKYCPDLRKKWLVWNGKYFETGDEELVKTHADTIVCELLYEASQTVDLGKRKELIEAGRKLQSARGVWGMLDLVKGDLLVRLIDLNNDRGLVNFNNGTLDMNTMTLMPHDPKQYLTRMIKHDYKPDATCPNWLSFLDFIAEGDNETVKWIQKALGWTLAGRSDGRILPFLYGEGGNGKSAFKEVLLEVFGDYAKTIPVETLLSRHFTADAESPTAFLRSLFGARLVFTAEMPKGRSINTERVKDLTGGDTLSFRGQHELEPLKFEPTHTLWVYGNDKPKIPDNSEGMWDRVKLIPFKQRIKDPRPMDEVKGWFRFEIEGILAWMIEGYRLALIEGLEPSQKIMQASKEYRKDEDTLQRFIDEEMVVAPNAVIKKKDFQKAYAEWLKQNNEGYAPSTTKVTQELIGKGFTVGGHGRSEYIGLGLMVKII
jgi:putative DNA primase/helicase